MPEHPRGKGHCHRRHDKHGNEVVGNHGKRSPLDIYAPYAVDSKAHGIDIGKILKHCGHIPYRRRHKEKPQQAEVVAVGPGGTVDGKEVKMNVTVGQQVIYSKYAGTSVEIEDEEYIVVKQDDILAIIE